MAARRASARLQRDKTPIRRRSAPCIKRARRLALHAHTTPAALMRAQYNNQNGQRNGKRNEISKIAGERRIMAASRGEIWAQNNINKLFLFSFLFFSLFFTAPLFLALLPALLTTFVHLFSLFRFFFSCCSWRISGWRGRAMAATSGMFCASRGIKNISNSIAYLCTCGAHACAYIISRRRGARFTL